MASLEKVCEILKCLYDQVYLLEDWINMTGNELCLPTLFNSDDPKSYLRLLKTTKIGIKKTDSSKQIPNCFSPTQNFHQREIIMRVIERILEKDEKSNNVLVLGFSKRSQNPDAHISMTSNIEHRYPNSSVNRLQYSSWQLLLSRIGDALMSYMLENTSVFLQIGDSSCFVQVAGESAQDLVSKLKCKTLLNSYPKSILHRCFKSEKDFNRHRKKNITFTKLKQVKTTKIQDNNPSVVLINSNSENTQTPNSQESYTDIQTSDRSSLLFDSSEERTQTILNKKVEYIPDKVLSVSMKRKGDEMESNSKRLKKSQFVKSCSNDTTYVLYDKVDILSVCKDTRLSGVKRLHHENEGENQDTKRQRLSSPHPPIINAKKDNLKSISKDPVAIGDIDSLRPKLVSSTLQNLPTVSEPGNIIKEIEQKKMKVDYKPYNFHLSLRRRNFLYGKNLCKKIPVLAGVDEIYNKIILMDVGCFIEVDDQLVSQRLKSIIEDFSRRYKKFPWFSMLNYHCPVLNLSNKCKRKGNRNYMNTARLLESFTSHDKVYLFLKVFVKTVMPEKLYGCQKNRNVFLKNINKFITQGKFDKICLGEVMNGIKVKSCTWLKKLSSPTVRSHLMAKLFHWLFHDIIISVIKTFFHVTDSSNYRNRIFFYRKAIWQKLNIQAFNAFRLNSCLNMLPKAEVGKLLKSEKSLGVAHLRFLPKTSSCRPIVNMGKNLSFPGINKTIPINKQLLNLLNVLSSYRRKQEVLGSSVFGTDDVYFKFKQFVDHRNVNNDSRKLYFVKTDIINCFDTIKPDKLYNIIQHILTQNNEEYITRRYFTVMAAGRRIRRLVHRDTRTLSDYNPDFFSFVRDEIKNRDLSNVILIDKVVNDHDSPSHLLQQLHALLFYNIIKVGCQYYKQEVGISQGSILSTLLCNFYYGKMESVVISVLSDELLMRMVDDFLYITPYKHRAVQFLTQIWKGNKDYNCIVNPDKIVTNFTCQMEDRDVQCFVDKDFAWCGFLINTTSLNVSVDYNRHRSLAVNDTMTFETGQNPGLAMKNKLMLSIRPKCHCLFLDPTINSEATIQINVSQLFQLIALKFQCYDKRLSYKQRSSNNTYYFLEMIVSLASYMFHQGKTKLKRLALHSKKVEFSLTITEIKWICVNSFIKQLSTYHAQFHFLLKCLKTKLRQLGKKLGKAKVKEIQSNIETQKFIFNYTKNY